MACRSAAEAVAGRMNRTASAMSARGQDRCGACMVLISKLSASARARWCDRTRIGGSLDRPASCPEAHYQRFMRGENSDRHALLVCESLYPSARRLCQFRCRLAPVSCRRLNGRIPPLWTAPKRRPTRSGGGLPGRGTSTSKTRACPRPATGSPHRRGLPRARSCRHRRLQPPPRPPCSAPIRRPARARLRVGDRDRGGGLPRLRGGALRRRRLVPHRARARPPGRHARAAT